MEFFLCLLLFLPNFINTTPIPPKSDCLLPEGAIINKCDLLMSYDYERLPEMRNQASFSCSDRYAVADESLTSDNALQFYGETCSAGQLSNIFNSQNLITWSLLLDSLTVEKFKEIVFTRNFRISNIWNENLLFTSLNLIAEKNFCNNYLDFFKSLDLSEDEEGKMALYSIQRMPVSIAVKLQSENWRSIDYFFKQIVSILSNERRNFSLDLFVHETAAKLYFHSYRSKLLNSADTIYLSADFKQNLNRFLFGTSPSIFDIIDSLDIIFMLEHDSKSRLQNLIQQKPEFGFKIYNKLTKIRSGSQHFYRSEYRIRSFLENPTYNVLLSPFVDPNDFLRTYDRGSTSQQFFLKSRWLPTSESDTKRGFMFKRFFVLNTLYTSWAYHASQVDYPVGQVLCVLTNAQFDYLFQSLRGLSLTLDWFDKLTYIPLECIDQLKAQKIVALKSEQFEMGILPSSYAEKLVSYGSLLPFVNWTIFTGSEVSPLAAQSFLCSSQCEQCSTSQKVALLEKLSVDPSYLNCEDSQTKSVGSEVLQYLSYDQVMRRPNWDASDPQLRRWQNLKVLEAKPNHELKDKDVNVYKPPRELAQDSFPNILYKLEPVFKSISEENLRIHKSSLFTLIKNSFLHKCSQINTFTIDQLKVFGIELIPASILLAAEQKYWPKEREVCHEFVAKIGSSHEIENELWVKRVSLKNHYLRYCSVHEGQITESDVIVMNKLACDLEPNELKKLGAQVFVENLSIFGKCCMSSEQLDAVRDFLGPISNWESFWFPLAGDLVCDLFDNATVRKDLSVVDALPLVEILTNQRSCGIKHPAVLGYKYSNRLLKDSNYALCMQAVSEVVLEKLQVDHYLALGWRDEKCGFQEEQKSSSLMTCASIMSIGANNFQLLKVEHFENLSNCEFDACVHYFGNCASLTLSQMSYVLNRTKHVRSYSEDWFLSSDRILELFQTLPALSQSEFEQVLLNSDINVVNRLLTIRKWSHSQSKSLYRRYSDLIGHEWTITHLSALTTNDVICYLDLESISDDLLISFVPVLRNFSPTCALDTEFFPAFWSRVFSSKMFKLIHLTAGDIQMLGTILIGLNSDQLDDFIGCDNVHELLPDVIIQWNSEMVNKLVDGFLRCMTADQTQAVLLSDKLNKNQMEKVVEQLQLSTNTLYKTITTRSDDQLSEATTLSLENSSDNTNDNDGLSSKDYNEPYKFSIVYITASSYTQQLSLTLYISMLLLKIFV